MELEIKFNDVQQAPKGAPRPRFRNTGKFVQTYMPASYTQHKQFIQKQLPQAMLETNLKIEIYFYYKPPKSWSKKRKVIALGKYKETKPDIDNLIKTVLDAGNNHLWKDDKQIVDIRSFKQYGEEAKIIMKLEEIGAEL
ncbi:RusA family crossover junction endodeoxyribonuclease [Staphylococcus auricularis]|uniref:RusA family crossover junction endodeoxyribonuclease n=1 Tax=Staphylococcus auricularis TaxID=29379 RepID=UPI000D1B290D|nr:RusA family crossover junction endodeoxyribonuclease [Staphylococcus auricularis]PTH23154.1 RusA family crossover junction endodeoxyribonuclease [Staphylococcus auricularis]